MTRRCQAVSPPVAMAGGVSHSYDCELDEGHDGAHVATARLLW